MNNGGSIGDPWLGDQGCRRCACVTNSAAATMNPPGRVSLLVYKGAWIAKGEDTLGTSNVDRKGRDSFQRSIFGLMKGRKKTEYRINNARNQSC